MFGLISVEKNFKPDEVGTEEVSDPGQSMTETAVVGSHEQSSEPISDSFHIISRHENFVTQMTKIFFNIAQTLESDFQIIFERDPAARHWLEVLCCYPGLHALVLYRIAHWLDERGVTFVPRFLSHLGRFLTGIEIHPGATIGRGVFIDHGMGVVIGETAIIGDYCLIYQNVTLGGTGKETGKRHPTLGNHVVVGTGAKVLGNISIGNHVRIGAGSIVLRNVPSDCTVVGIPGRIISRNDRGCPLEHGKLPDVEASVIRSLLDRIELLEEKLAQFNSEGTNSQSVEEKSVGITSSEVEKIIFAHSVDLEQEFLLCELPQATSQEVVLEPLTQFCGDNGLIEELSSSFNEDTLRKPLEETFTACQIAKQHRS